MIIALLIIMGLSLGSFVNALVWRLYRQQLITEKAKKLTKADKKQLDDLSIVHGRSMCMNCGHQLSSKDLVPVASWLWLRGKCRYCGVRIPDTPLAELLVPSLFVLSYVSWTYELAGWRLATFGLWLLALVIFVALALYDIRWFILPNKLVYPLTGISALFVITRALQGQDWGLIWVALLGAGILFGLFWALFQISGGNWIGGGDVKLAVALGLLAGSPLRALLVIFFASLIGTIVGLPQLVGSPKRKQHTIPFGPPLIFATIIVVLWGTQIVTWYQGFLY